MKTLVDTSIWIDHFRNPNEQLIALLRNRTVVVHSSIIGEIAAGSLKKRLEVLGDLKLIPKIESPPDHEILEFIEIKKLFGLGLSWIDIELLAAALVNGTSLLTGDKRLKKVFESL